MYDTQGVYWNIKVDIKIEPQAVIQLKPVELEASD